MEASISSQNHNPETAGLPHCWKCKSTLDKRVARGMLVKFFLFWMPLRRYFCYGCMTKRYVRDKH